MPDAVMLPDGKILIVNGAKSGTAGYGNVQNQVSFLLVVIASRTHVFVDRPIERRQPSLHSCSLRPCCGRGESVQLDWYANVEYC